GCILPSWRTGDGCGAGVSHAGALAGACGGDDVCGCAIVLGVVVVDGGSDGWAGDYRGISGHQIPYISAPADNDRPGDRDYRGGSRSAEDTGAVAGGAEFFTTVCIDSVVSAGGA